MQFEDPTRPTEVEFWLSIRTNGYAVPEGYTVQELVPGLLDGLASMNQAVRDDLCNAILSRWIKQGLFSANELRDLINRLHRNLRLGIGSRHDDSVLLRAYSILILSAIVSYDSTARSLSATDIHQILEIAIEYLVSEQDLRGHIPGKGWVDALNHSTYVLRALARHPGVSSAELEKLLDGITLKFRSPTHARFATTDEVEMSEVIIAIIQRGILPTSRLKQWFADITWEDLWEAFVRGEESEHYHNVRAFLLGLHFLLHVREISPEIRSELLPALHESMRTYSILR